jgi:hypothetical protein
VAPHRCASVSSPDKAEICHRMGAELVIDRSSATGEGYRVLDRRRSRRDSRTSRSGAGSGRRSARSPAAATPTSSSSTRAGRRSARASSWRARAARSSPAPRRRVPARVRQPVPLDEPQAHHRLALRELPRGVGGQRPHRPRADPPDPEPGRTRSEDVGQAAYDVHRNLHQGKVGVLTARAPRGPRRHRPEKRDRFATSSAGSATCDGPASADPAGARLASKHARRRRPAPRSPGPRAAFRGAAARARGGEPAALRWPTSVANAAVTTSS